MAPQKHHIITGVSTSDHPSPQVSILMVQLRRYLNFTTNQSCSILLSVWLDTKTNISRQRTLEWLKTHWQLQMWECKVFPTRGTQKRVPNMFKHIPEMKKKKLSKKCSCSQTSMHYLTEETECLLLSHQHIQTSSRAVHKKTHSRKRSKLHLITTKRFQPVTSQLAPNVIPF